MPRLLDLARKRLGWPRRGDILRPSGAGARVVADAAKAKIGARLSRIRECRGANVGVLSANSRANSTDTPIAVLCEFARPVSTKTLLKVHRLAWNFSRSPQLITVEPTVIRSFTCCEVPGKDDPSEYEVSSVTEADLQDESKSLVEQAEESLHWVNLVSGRLLRGHERRFRRSQRADHMLLRNLRHVRHCLLEDERGKLNEDICHDLLARVMFTQFLWDRKDSSGNAALDEGRLEELRKQRVLSDRYSGLSGILRNRDDAYSFFAYLDGKFNGDLFAGRDDPGKTRRQNWQREKRSVMQHHLDQLADLIEGKLDMPAGQYCLWPQYRFDVIPLEFISSIYEEFLSRDAKKAGAHYTPPHLVDFLLDGVLPWDGKEWDLKVLDPACGSGIFLVRAYQRLIHRWKLAHKGRRPGVAVLRRLLEGNLLGVDRSPQAVRVASFSLYLAMCDEIEPMRLWRTVKFPRLRGRRLIAADFFEESRPSFRTDKDAGTYDLVVGNVPWGKGTVEESPAARRWARRGGGDSWPIPYKDIGPLFLPKSLALTRKGGCVSLIQNTPSLLMNRQGPAMKFREKLFTTFAVQDVTNLSACRFGIFKDSVSPASIITARPGAPTGEPIRYMCPKPLRSCEDDYFFVIEPHDVNWVRQKEAAEDPGVWSALMWGGRRDFSLIRSLRERNSLLQLSNEGRVRKRGCVIRGRKRQTTHAAVLGRRVLESKDDEQAGFLFLDAGTLPVNSNAKVHIRSSTDYSAFDVPQLLLKQSWQAGGRFRAFMVLPDSAGKGVIPTLTYVTVHSGTAAGSAQLEAACLVHNSILAVYYLFLTSGRCSAYRPTALVEDVLAMPIPEAREGLLDGLRDYADVDARTREAFGLSDVEWALVEDLFAYTIPHYKTGTGSSGEGPAGRGAPGRPEIEAYCDYFRRVLKAGFGRDKKISATVFDEGGGPGLPVRLVAIHLDSPRGDTVSTERMDSGGLADRLGVLYEKHMEAERGRGPGIAFRRTVRVYDAAEIEGRSVPTVYLVKPDEARCWTRSAALRDADEVAADLVAWHAGSAGSPRRKGR